MQLLLENRNHFFQLILFIIRCSLFLIKFPGLKNINHLIAKRTRKKFLNKTLNYFYIKPNRMKNHFKYDNITN